MKNKKTAYIVQAAVGAVLFAAGLLVFPKDGAWAQFGACIGFGAAFLAVGLSNMVYLAKLSPEEQEKINDQKQIEVNDERNVRIREKAGHMVAKVMTYVLCAFVLILALMGAAQAVVLLAAGLLAVHLVLWIVFSNYYYKKF